MDPKERTKGTHKGLHCHLVAPKGITLEVVCEMFVFKYLLILASGPFQNALSYFFCGPGRDGHVTTPCVHVFTPLKMMKLSERVGSPSWSPRILILTLPSASGVLHCTALSFVWRRPHRPRGANTGSNLKILTAAHKVIARQ